MTSSSRFAVERGRLSGCCTPSAATFSMRTHVSKRPRARATRASPPGARTQRPQRPFISVIDAAHFYLSVSSAARQSARTVLHLQALVPGALIAYEIACMLEAQGESVVWLGSSTLFPGPSLPAADIPCSTSFARGDAALFERAKRLLAQGRGETRPRRTTPCSRRRARSRLCPGADSFWPERSR